MSARAFSFGSRRPPRRPSLTPMIDVVFLLLVFFMLAARFGTEAGLPLVLGAPDAGAEWHGPPRLVDVTPEGQRLNGVAADLPALLAGLSGLVAGPDDPVLLRAREGATLQRVIAVFEALTAAGHRRVVVVE